MAQDERHLNRVYARNLHEIEDFRFDASHPPGARSPTDPLSRRGFADGDGGAAPTGDPDPESQQELVSRLSRDAPAPALLAAIRVGWAHARRSAAAASANFQEGDARASTPPLEGGGIQPPVYWYLRRSRRLRTPAERWGHAGSAAAGILERPPLSPAFVQPLAAEPDFDPIFAPVRRVRGGRAGQARRSARRSCPQPRTHTHGRDVADALWPPPLPVLWTRQEGSLVRRLAFCVGKDVDCAEYVRSCQTCQRTKAEHGGPGSSIPCLCL